VIQLTDTHCHLNLPVFQNDIEAVLERAWEKGVERILVPGVNLETSRSAVALAEEHPQIYAAVGVHPGDAKTWDDDTLAILRDLARHPKTIAIGEIGLDYYRDRSPRLQQREVLRAQLSLAAETSLPVILHNRQAFDDLWTDLAAWKEESGRSLEKPLGVLHSFDGSTENPQQAIENGFFIGIGGPVTYQNAPERQKVAAALSLDHILIETDAPYLTPHPHRGQRNEPAYVSLVIDKLSELHGISHDTVAQKTWRNAATLFHWERNL